MSSVTVTTRGEFLPAIDEEELSFVEAIRSALDFALGDDDDVFLLGEDIEDPVGGVMKATKGLSTKYGRARVRGTPISEQAIVGAAIGASLAGMKPVAEIMVMDFFAVAMDQVVNHAAKLRYMSGGRTNVPITIRTAVGGNCQFGAQHSQSLEAWFMHAPGLKVCVPSTPRDAKGLLLACIADEDPCIYMESIVLLGLRGPVPSGGYSIPIGSADVKRAGKDVTVITWGWLVHEVLAVANDLATEGIDVEVVDLRSLVPIDRQLLCSSVSKTKRALVVHAATEFAGPGAEISALLHEELFTELESPVVRLGGANSPVPFAKNLEHAFYPDQVRIKSAIYSMVR